MTQSGFPFCIPVSPSPETQNNLQYAQDQVLFKQSEKD